MLRHRSSIPLSDAVRHAGLTTPQRRATSDPSLPSPNSPIQLSDTEDEIDDGDADERAVNRAVTPSAVRQAAEAQASADGLPSFSPDHEFLDFAKAPTGAKIRPNHTVECYDGTFLRVVYIIRDVACNIYLRGILLMRHKHVDRQVGPHHVLHSLLPRKTNEVCAVLKVTSNAQCLDFDGSLVSKSIGDVVKVRKTIFTNAEFPAFREHHENRQVQEEEGQLVCRWKYIEEIHLKREKVVGFCLMQLEEYECDPGKSIPRVRKFKGYQRETKPRRQISHDDFIEVSREEFNASTKRKRVTVDLLSDGSDMDDHKKRKREHRRVPGKDPVRKSTTLRDSNGYEETVAYEIREEHVTKQNRKRKARPDAHTSRKRYIYADLCAGAGGMAIGAKLAGLMIGFVLEHEAHACKTLVLNFGEDVVLQMDLSNFATNGHAQNFGGYIVDVMHLSLPCQAHSAANRHQNPELDAERIALAYGTVDLLLQRCRPRIVTLEQVQGIMKRSFGGQHLRAQIAALTSAGYSCRWRLNNLAEYGGPQARKRLIIMAACPGQILPCWPKPTHGNGPGLKPFVTIKNILDNVPQQLRDPMSHSIPRNCPRYDPNTVLRHCITRSGGGSNLHPSGNRTFNLQQLAQLQGFPAHHRFHGSITSIMTQIGNAVPAVFAKVLFEKSVIPALEKTDEEIGTYEEEARLQNERSARNPIVLG